MMPDNYEYPFDIVLDGGLPESIEGLPESWIVYRFKGEIGRKYSKDIQIRKPLRIIRTLGPSALETAHEMVRHLKLLSVTAEMLMPIFAVCGKHLAK